MSLRINQLEKKFGSYTALNNINLTVKTGEFLALLGPSGCGKTTLLRIISGLEAADSGQIFFDNEDVTQVNVKKRKVGMVFQNYALFRHMTIFDNVAFGLRVKPRRERLPEGEIKKRVKELLELIQLDWLEGAYPAKLSGGQKQRVALARALAVAPKVLLLDEPFGALDAKVRKELRFSLRELQHQLGITCILVTHDQEEALTMADKIVLMNQGKIEQIGTGSELYNHPQSAFATKFLGDVNVFPEAKISGRELRIGDYHEPAPAEFHGYEQSVAAYVRPEDIALSREPLANHLGEATIIDIQEVGSEVRLFLVTPHSEDPLQALLSRRYFAAKEFALQEKIYFKPTKTFVFARDDYQI